LCIVNLMLALNRSLLNRIYIGINILKGLGFYHLYFKIATANGSHNFCSQWNWRKQDAQADRDAYMGQTWLGLREGRIFSSKACLYLLEASLCKWQFLFFMHN
jgi:hypothetical protein